MANLFFKKECLFLMHRLFLLLTFSLKTQLKKKIYNFVFDPLIHILLK